MKYTDVTLEIQHGRSLASLNTLGLDVIAEHYACARSEDELCEALAWARDRRLPVTVLGGGSNVVFRSNITGLVLHVGTPGILFDNETVEAGAGENWHQLVLASLEHGLCGLENLSLIPGSVGAAPIQNIGAYGTELSGVFDSLSAIDRDSLESLTLSAADCRFGYRDSIFKGALKDRLVISSVRISLSRTFRPNLDYEGLRHELEQSGAGITAHAVSEAVCALRRRKLPDPEVEGNVGSFFKNPVVSAARLSALLAEHPGMPAWNADGAKDGAKKVSAGWLIEHCGLKGRVLGGAAVSERHALVIVNRGPATGEDVIALAALVQERVFAEFGISLEIEPRVY